MAKIKEIISAIEEFAPLAFQESYDNSGVQVGDAGQEAKSALVCIDVTEAVVDEAITKGCNLIIAHHPLVFKDLRSLTGKDYIEKCLIKAIKNDIVIYAAHTNLDNAWGGVSFKMAEKLGLKNIKVLAPVDGKLLKLVTFVPVSHIDIIRNSLFTAGAGHIGNYDQCSYNSEGYGTFRAGEGANPFCGQQGEMHKESEVRLETIFPSHIKGNVIRALLSAHPYEEPAFDIIALENEWNQVGSGVIGELERAEDELSVLGKIKQVFEVSTVKYSPLQNKQVTNIAICGGSGSFLIIDALRAGADLFLTGEIKYHDFFNHRNSILLADIGHYESEQYTIELICEIIRKKFPTFAVHFTECKTNQINYL
ncbi:Nif3-like dinuclear metal center hexameric protein [Parabacteroides sp. FAFU027]|uniref:Nif3-like dinuclear metal center hexameric protein n=1 Tax=Parabacteroides sp. FAFU027 TaxID=2922715 RepID=UPI001FB00692|nr:Nif3-like dinuclear metal center hexameric protein [Parabacteroides sp. FAFU027]